MQGPITCSTWGLKHPHTTAEFLSSCEQREYADALFPHATCDTYVYCQLSLERVFPAGYMLNIFGFASTPALNDSLNAGLYDQRLGMKWISENIHLFGGDAHNITVFGQSSGAVSVRHHINAFPDKPIYFHRAILESGASTTVAGTTSNIDNTHTQTVARWRTAPRQTRKHSSNAFERCP